MPILGDNGVKILYKRIIGKLDEFKTEISTTYSVEGHVHNYAGSSSAGGSANSAVKLDTSAGTATQPVYFKDGVPVACTYTVEKSVPSDAKFTDTVYTHPGEGTNPHGTTKSDVGLGDVGNFKAVSTVASQGLSDTEKSNARANIGAGTSSLAIGTTATTAAAGDHTHKYAGSSSVGGAATSATKLATARTITISGAVSGSASFDGSKNITINTTVLSGTAAPDTLTTGALFAVYEN